MAKNTIQPIEARLADVLQFCDRDPQQAIRRVQNMCTATSRAVQDAAVAIGVITTADGLWSRRRPMCAPKPNVPPFQTKRQGPD